MKKSILILLSLCITAFTAACVSAPGQSSSSESTQSNEVSLNDESSNNELSTDESALDELSTDESSTEESSKDESSNDELSTDESSTDESLPDESSTDESKDEEKDYPPLTMTQVSTVTDNFLNISAFAEFLASGEKFAFIPGLREGIVPQGIARNPATGYYYISAYFTTKNTASVILVLNEKGEFVAEYHMYNENGKPFTGHMGGICATENYIYFSGPSTSDGYYSVGELAIAELPEKGAHDITFTSTVALPIYASYLFYDNGMLWAGNFYLEGSYDLGKFFNQKTASADGKSYGGYSAMFRVDNETKQLTIPEGEKYAVPEVTLAAPDKVQGFAYKDGKVALSISYGRNNNSTLDFFEIDITKASKSITVDGKEYPLIILDSGNRIKKVVAMGMTEGLTLSENGDIIILFESGAQNYSNAKNPTDCIWSFPIPEKK